MPRRWGPLLASGVRGPTLGWAPCRVSPSPPTLLGGGGCRAGGRGRPGAGGFPAAGCEGCAARSRFPVDDGGFRPRVVVRAVHRPKASARGGRRPAPCTRTADPHPPGAGVVRAPWPSPAGKCPGPGAMPPSVRKPSLAIRRGCLGVPHPPAAAPRLRVSVWPALGFQGGSSAPCGEGPERCSPGLPRPAPPPTESGEGHARARARHPRCGFGGRVGRGLRAALNAARRGEVCGAGRLRPRRLPLLRVERLSARSRPEPRPVGAARARVVGPPRSGESLPWGVCGVSRAATGRLERESARVRRRTPFEGMPLGGGEVRAGGPRRRGPGSGQACGGGLAEAGRRPGRRGAALVCGGGIPARFPGGPSASSFLSRGLPPRVRPFSSRAPVLSARPPPRRRRFAPSRPGASRGRPPAARGCRPCPHIGRRAAAPPGGGPPRAR